MAVITCLANFHVNQVETTSASASFLMRTTGVITQTTVNSQQSVCLSKLTNTRK